MGEAHRRKLEEGRVVLFDFAAPALHMMKGDRDRFATDSQPCDKCGALLATHPDRAVARAVRFVMQQVIQAAFPQGMGRLDGAMWAAWLETMDDDADAAVQVTLGQVDWLKRHLLNNDVRIQPGIAQWREALGFYLCDLRAVETDMVNPHGGVN